MQIRETSQPSRLQVQDFIVGEAVEPVAHAASSARPTPVPGAERRSISIVVPVLNEQRGLPLLERRLVLAMEALGRPFEIGRAHV